jgi:flagellar hook-associated protein 1 FlgK
MSLFGTIQMGANALHAMQIGLQVTGNNIANAATPGFVRQEVVYAPAPVQKVGTLILGLGVQVDGIIDKIDRFVLDRLVGARGERAGAELKEGAYLEIEGLINGLSGEVDLGSSLATFFNSIGEVLNDPTSAAARNLVVGQGSTLASTFNNLASRAQTLRREYNNQITASADEINNITEMVRQLNIQIATVEGGGSSNSDAGGLRNARQIAIDRLAEMIGITVVEQSSGAVNISVGGDFLVFEGQRRAVEIALSNGDGMTLSTVRFADTKSAVVSSTGQLSGLYAARDEVVGGFLSGLNELAGLLAFEFNKVYSQGQGIAGFEQLISASAVVDADAALDTAGLAFTPVSGQLQLLVHNKSNDITKTHDILIDLNGIDHDTTLNDVAAALNAIEGISAQVTASGRLELAVDSADTEFAFAGDTSGFLAAIGLNTFFTGSTANDIGVNAELKGLGNEAKFAASAGGLGRDTDTGNAAKLFQLLEKPLASAGELSLPDVYDRLVNTVTQGATVAKSVAEGFRVFEGTLDGQLQAVSGVSLDEEAVRLLTLQRIYQASARFIQAAAEMLDVLVNL